MALILVLLAEGLTWLGQGHPLHPAWAGLALVPLSWAAGLRFGLQRLVGLGFVGLVALAAYCTMAGGIPTGLGVLGLALMAWDASTFSMTEDVLKQISPSALVVGTGLALAFAFSIPRFSLNFWALLGGLLLTWLAIWAWLREAFQPPGGKANGNRSASESMR